MTAFYSWCCISWALDYRPYVITTRRDIFRLEMLWNINMWRLPLNIVTDTMPSFTFLEIYILQLDQHCTITFLKFAFSKWALRCIRNSIRTEVAKFILCRSRDYERPLYDQQENPVAACDAAGPRYQSTHRLFCFCFSFIFRCSLFYRRHVEANRTTLCIYEWE